MKTFLIITLLTLIHCSYSRGFEIENQFKSFKEMLAKMVEADTSNPPGNEARIVLLVSHRLKQAGIPFDIVQFAPGRENLVARIKGAGKQKPLLLLAHTDVVGTQGQKWSVPPHTLTEKKGYLYGRGVADDLGMAAMELEVFLSLKRDNVALKRDVIFALTGDEESGGTGIRYLLKTHPELIDAGIALNEGGGPVLGQDGKVKYIRYQPSEKTYEDFILTAHGTTGHSSVPLPDNAIVRLSRALTKISDNPAPINILPVTRAYFGELASLQSAPLSGALRVLSGKAIDPDPKAVKVLAAHPTLEADLRTTCVPTLVTGGTRVNALPASATANVNCRILPDEAVETARRRLEKIINDPKIEVRAVADFGEGGSAPLDGEVPSAIRRISQEVWPGSPVIPVPAHFTTDSRFLRQRKVAAYGINPIGMTESDERGFHGIDERIQEKSIRPGLIFLNKLVRDLSAG